MSLDTEKFKDLFLGEAEGQVAILTSTLLEIEKAGGNVTQYEQLMRSAHTIKGASATMGYEHVAELSHALEDIFHSAERGVLSIDSVLVTTLLSTIDVLSASLLSIKNGGAELLVENEVKILRDILLHPIATTQTIDAPRTTPIPTLFSAPSIIKVSTDRLDGLMGTLEELLMLQLKLNTTLQPALEALKDTNDAGLKQKLFFVHEFRSLFIEMSRLLAENQESLLAIRLVPLEQIFGQYPRMVRDLAVRENKKIEFIIRGGDIALDRTVIDGLGGALAHLLRNAIDHGIVGSGTIVLSAVRERGRAKVTVEDDGAGIDYKRIREVALSRGVETEERIDAMSTSALAELIFHPNMSTNNEVTDISGRGVGVSAVHAFARDVGGRLEILSPIPSIGRGTRFTLDLPVSLATVRVLIVFSGGYTFAIPFEHIVRTHEFKESDVTVAAHQENLFIDGAFLPLLRLKDILGLGIQTKMPDQHLPQIGILIHTEKIKAVIAVESCAGEQDLLVKSLPPVLHGIKGFSGSALLPDGRTILLLDFHGLLLHAVGDILEHTPS